MNSIAAQRLKPLPVIADPRKPFLLRQGVRYRVVANERGQLVAIAEPPVRHFCEQCAGERARNMGLPR